VTFLAPGRLWLLLLPLALVAVYVVAQRARRRYAVRFTNLELLASVAPKRPGWRRHVTAGLLVATIALLTVGFARPATEERVPREKATVVLALDVSTSMAATDVDPSRIVAAQAAARDFVRALPQPLELGLVVFSRSASVQVAPTEDREAVVRAIDGLTLGPSTAIGEAIFASLGVLEPQGVSDTGATDKAAAHIVLMSDGTTTVGRPNAEGVAAAVEAGVPVTTIAYGTDEGTVQVSGQTIPVPVDRDSLKEIADGTGGRFFEAADADQLRAVYEDIGRVVGYDVEQREITAVLVGLALLTAFAAAAGSLFWMGRLP
jgi:Ca-activated chloride channel family protein